MPKSSHFSKKTWFFLLGDTTKNQTMGFRMSFLLFFFFFKESLLSLFCLSHHCSDHDLKVICISGSHDWLLKGAAPAPQNSSRCCSYNPALSLGWDFEIWRWGWVSFACTENANNLGKPWYTGKLWYTDWWRHYVHISAKWLFFLPSWDGKLSSLVAEMTVREFYSLSFKNLCSYYVNSPAIVSASLVKVSMWQTTW